VKTFKKRLGITLQILDAALPKLRFVDRFDGWWRKVPSCIVDVLKCPISEPTERSWENLIGTNQFGLKYEVGLAIGSPRIVWLAGPFKGTVADGTIPKVSGLLEALGEDEAALADKSYRHNRISFITTLEGHQRNLKAESNAYNAIVYSARSAVERVIKRVRNGKWTKNIRYSGDYQLHKVCMHMQCRLTNWCLMYEPLG